MIILVTIKEYIVLKTKALFEIFQLFVGQMYKKKVTIQDLRPPTTKIDIFNVAIEYASQTDVMYQI